MRVFVVCVCFSRIVSESKALVNGIDACMEQAVTVDLSDVGNNSLTAEQSLPPEPVNSPSADSTEASVSGSSWFTGLTSVVDSPNSYPKWCNSETVVSSQSCVTNDASEFIQSSSPEYDGDVANDELEPPAKRQLLDHTSLTGDDVSTTTVFSPLLCQLLSSSAQKGESQSVVDGVADDGFTVNSATGNVDQPFSTDENAEVTANSEVEDEQHEGLTHHI